jgi:predicted enzyme related to lactoylglutathione lyase
LRQVLSNAEHSELSTEKTPHYTAGVPCWVDALQHDPNAAVEFYGKLLGWTFVGPAQTPHGGKYFVAQLNGRDVLSVPPFNTPFSRNTVLMDPQGAVFSIHAI